MKSELTGKPCSENIIRLYRGTSKKGYTKYVANTVFSATWNREVAANFGDVVYELLNVTASDILIDTTLFTPDNATVVFRRKWIVTASVRNIGVLHGSTRRQRIFIELSIIK